MNTAPCKSIGCSLLVEDHKDFCTLCSQASLLLKLPDPEPTNQAEASSLDTFAIHQMFGINDPSGCIQHASRKLLMSGNDDQPLYSDIVEARDTLTRWLQLNQGL